MQRGTLQDGTSEVAGSTGALPRLGLALGFVVVLLVLLVPPFQAPDEHRHFLRAYQLSEGGLLPYPPDPGAPEGRTVQSLHTPLGGMLPRGIDDLLIATEADRLRFKPAERIDPGRIVAALSVKAKRHERVYFRFAHTIVYPPYIYLPQVIGIGAARAITDRILVHFYAARLANAAAALALLVLALRAAPSLWPLTLAFWTIPVVQFQSGSLSLDALVNAAALAFAVLCLTRAGPRGTPSWTMKVLLAMVVCSKLAYAPLCLLLAAERGSSAAGRALGVLLPVCPLLLWMVFARDVIKPPRVDLDIDPGRQLMWLAGDPFRAARILLEDWAQHGAFYGRSMVGILGWLDRPLPSWHVALAYGLLAGGTWLARRPLERSGLLLWLAGLAVVGSLFLIEIALLLTFTPVGAAGVQGVQGRYFLPLLPAALLGLRSIAGDPVRPTMAAKAFAAGLVLSWVGTVGAVVASYYAT